MVNRGLSRHIIVFLSLLTFGINVSRGENTKVDGIKLSK